MTADSTSSVPSGADGSPPVYGWHPKIACRTLDGTAFILLGSRMLSLNSVGSRIWELFESGATVTEVIDAITAEFETTRETAAADTQNFVDLLLERQLLVPQSQNDPTGAGLLYKGGDTP